jgi:hypothetical protein
MSGFQGIEVKIMKFSIKPTERGAGIIRLIKFDDDINVQPFVLVKKTILDNTDIPSWNTRKLILFNFDSPNLNNTVNEVIAQYTIDDFTSYNFNELDVSIYSVFKIIKIKKRGETIFKNIQEEIDAFDTNGAVDPNQVQLENINITKNSFDFTTGGAIERKSRESKRFLMFVFNCNASNNFFDNTVQIPEVIDNMIYIYNNDFTTGFSSGYVQSSIKFKLLMDNTDEIAILNTTPVSNYNTVFRLHGSQSNITSINPNTNSIITLFIEIIDGVTNNKINLRFSSNDIIFNTFIPEFKIVGSTQYLVSSRPSGLNPDIYVFNISVFKISAIDKITRSTTSVLNLKSSREIEIIIEPDVKDEYFGGSQPIIGELQIDITNNALSMLSMRTNIIFPNKDSNTNVLSNPTFRINSRGNLNQLNNQLLVDLTLTNPPDLFKNIIIPSLSVQIASITSNTNKCFINTASILYNPNVIINTATGTLEDLSSATLTGTNTQHAITAQTYNFSVKIVDGQFLIEYETTLQIDPISKRFSLVDDVFFQAYENDVYIFDTSDSSNKDHLMTFFSSATINSNNELIDSVVYSNVNHGEAGSKITLTVPSYAQFSNIYISDFPSGNTENRLTGLCRINILPNPTNIITGTFNFSLLVGNGFSTMSFVPNKDSNDIPINGINDIIIGNDAANTDASRINELFSAGAPIPTIQVYSIYLSKPENIEFVVFNKTYVLLTWKLTNNSNIYPFANPRESRYPIDVYYNVYREDIDTNVMTLLGTSIINTFTDITAVNFNNYNYYIESVATWEESVMVSQKSNPLFVFVCENNRFPDGRWNNSFSNPKLYKELSTCGNRNNITSTLFPNSWSMSRKETYARLAKLSINKR